MSQYSADNWKILGKAVRHGRLNAGKHDTKAWAEEVGRSPRILLGLERGEAVGPKTLERIERALDWAAGRAHAMLEGDWRRVQQMSTGPAVEPAAARKAREGYLVELALRTAVEFLKDGGDAERAVELLKAMTDDLALAADDQKDEPAGIRARREQDEAAERGDG